jgi:drug/metabolite transporter (DMT)-like permease
MDFWAIILVVTAAFVHAAWNLLAKRAGGGRLFIWSYSAVTAILYLPLIAWLLYAYPVSWSPLIVAAILVSGILHLSYSICLQTGYRKADLSVVYPVARGAGPTLSVIGAIVLLGEPATPGVLAGAALIISGVLVIGLAGRRPGGSIWPGVRWGALTGVMIASYTLADGYTVKVLALSPILLDYFGNLVRLAALTPYALANREALLADWRRSPWPIVGVGAIIPVSYVLALYAMTRAPVSVIAPARELSMMVGVLLGWWLLKEPDVGRRLAGAALIACGVVLLAL